MERLPTGRAGTIRLLITDEDGVPVDPLVAPAVVIDDGAGTQVASGTAGETATTGLWTFTVPASVTADLDTYSATWSFELDGDDVTVTTRFEVCGSHLFEIAELRAFDNALADDTAYTADAIRKARVDAEERFEKGARVAFTARARRVSMEGDGTATLLLPDTDVRELLAVEVDGVAVDVADLTLKKDVGVVEAAFIWAKDSIVDVFYTHGRDELPEPVRRAVKTLAVEYLVPSGLPARATSQSTDLGEFRLSLADRTGLTGIPEVDSVMVEFGNRRPSVG